MVAQSHLDRLSPVDAGFLYLEEDGAHMHIGGLAVLEGPPPNADDFLRHVGDRLHLVPRYRQKLAFPPFGSGRPWWVDDPCFNLEYHVRHTALPRPGTDEQLHTLVGRIMSQRLDRTKPLWELWLIEGLSDDRFAFISKTHHAVVDGVGGIDLLSTVFDLSPEPQPVEPPFWHARSTPSSVGRISRMAGDLLKNTAGVGVRAAGLVRTPAQLVKTAEDLVGAAIETARTLVDAAPSTVLNVKPGPHRRYTVLREQLSDFKRIKNAFGGTVNDVVLTVVSSALGTFLAERGTDVDGLELRACVPVSIRADAQANAGGNEITIMVARLPVWPQDPVDRLRRVSESMAQLKASKQALSARLISQLNYFAPPTILAQASRLAFSPRLYNLLVTNVPGPQIPVYMMGRRLLEVFPVAFLAPTHALAVAVLSYNGAVNLGLIADYDAVPDLDVFAKHLDAALGELLDRAT